MNTLNTMLRGKSEQESEKIIKNNKENVKRFKDVISKLVESQKENKKVTRSPHTEYSKVWPRQNDEREMRAVLFKNYTAYYIVKHYLWLDENKEEREAYLNKVTSEAKKALHRNDSWLCKHTTERFLNDVNKLVEEYTMELNDEQESRLYVLIDKNLDPVYGCVQGGHAVAQWLIDHKDDERKWNNNYLIYLYADLEKWAFKLDGIKNVSYWREPDLDNKLTSIAVETDGKIFKHLKLVK